jgi:peroxiredoxin
MRRRALLALPLAWAGAALASEVGTAAPAFDLAGPAGRVRLRDLRGKLVYLDFWASWCAPCRLSFPWMNDMQARHGARGLQVVGINVDTQRADADRFLARVPARFTIAFDPAGDSPRAYAVKQMPSSFLIGADGRVLYTHAGWHRDDAEALEQRIVRALPKR